MGSQKGAHANETASYESALIVMMGLLSRLRRWTLGRKPNPDSYIMFQRRFVTIHELCSDFSLHRNDLACSRDGRPLRLRAFSNKIWFAKVETCGPLLWRRFRPVYLQTSEDLHLLSSTEVP